MTAVVAAVNTEPTTAQQSAPPGDAGNKPNQLVRLRKIEGQVRAVARMVAEDRYCIGVLTQVSAVTGASHEVAMGLLDDHVRHCVLDAARDDPAVAKPDQLTRAMPPRGGPGHS